MAQDDLQAQTPYPQTCPMTYTQVVERYFLEHRAKLIDLAAFLDRLERTNDRMISANDYRVEALQEASMILSDTQGEKARRIQELFSDQTQLPIAKAPGKGASGVVHPDVKEGE